MRQTASTHGLTDDALTPPAPSATHRLVWAASGLGFLGLTALGLLVANVFSSALYPSPLGPPFGASTDVGTYFEANRAQVRAMSSLYAAAALCLLVFAGYGAGQLADVTPSGRSPLPWLAIAAGGLAAGLWLITALLLWSLTQPETIADVSVVHALHGLAYATGGPGHVLTLGTFVGAVSLALRRNQVLPAWVGLIGQLAAALSVASLLVLLFDPASLLLPLARSLALLWILVTCVALLRHRTEPEPLDAPRSSLTHGGPAGGS
jgi:hypothetical protein